MTREFNGRAIQKIESVRGGILKVVTVGGNRGEIPVKTNEETFYPEGAIESLFRRLPLALSGYGHKIVSDDPGWLDEIVKKAKYDTPEQAIPSLRNVGISARNAAEGVYSLMLNAGVQVKQGQKEILVGALERDIRSLYAATTEVRPRKGR